MYNRLFTCERPKKKFFIQNNFQNDSLFKTIFQSGRSTEHAILQLANRIHESFENNLYNSGVFVDLGTDFHIVKDYLRYETINSQNVLSGAHVKNIFI